MQFCLFNQIQQDININHLNSKILSNKKVIKNLSNYLLLNLFFEKINTAKTNPLSSEVKEVIEEFLPILASMSKNTVYKAIKWLKHIREIKSMFKRYRLSSFLLLLHVIILIYLVYFVLLSEVILMRSF